MKKIFKKCLCIICAAALFPTCVKAEATEIEGLHESLQRLIMSECFTEEEIEAMDNEFMEYRSNFLRTQYIPGWIYLHPSTSEEEAEKIYEERMNAYILDYSRGIRISSTFYEDYYYFDVYANEKKLYYLFDGYEFWTVPSTKYPDAAKFKITGERIENIDNELGHTHHVINFSKDSGRGEKLVAFLKEEKSIEQMLLNFGEKYITDIKIFALDGIPTLYIRCGENEYLAFGDEGSVGVEDYEVQSFILYDAKYLMDIRESKKRVPESAYSMHPQKSTYEAEATALQEEGLLYGNENGLDLLKPMTRIEAATMILRAIGNDDTATASVFSDVPSWHWGYNAANVAYERGITSGIGNGKFAPERTITAEEFSAMILRLTDIGDFDWQNSVNILTERGIISKDDARTMDLFTRGDMAKIIYEIRAHGLRLGK